RCAVRSTGHSGTMPSAELAGVLGHSLVIAEQDDTHLRSKAGPAPERVPLGHVDVTPERLGNRENGQHHLHLKLDDHFVVTWLRRYAALVWDRPMAGESLPTPQTSTVNPARRRES